MKTVSGVIEHHIEAATNYHNLLHGFKAGLGMGNTSIESNLLQQLVEMRE